MCKPCENNYYYSKLAHKCKKCTDTIERLAISLVCTVVAVIVALIAYFLVLKLCTRLPRCLPVGVRLFDIGKFKVCACLRLSSCDLTGGAPHTGRLCELRHYVLNQLE